MTLKLRHKLAMTFGGLLLILASVGIMASILLRQYSSTLEKVFRENYDSVAFGQSMKDAIDSIDGTIQKSFWDVNGEENGGLLNAPIDLFEKQLSHESANITIAGEGKLVEDLERKWKNFRLHLNQWLALPTADEKKRFYKDVLENEKHEIKLGVQAIIDINLGNVTSVDGKVKESANFAQNALLLSILAALGISFVFIGFTGRIILKPLEKLRQNAQEIAKGNLDLIISKKSKDEFGELAAAFEEMTVKLREYRQFDQTRLYRTQKTTQVAINTFPDAVAVVGLDGKIELSNDVALRFGLEQGSDLANVPLKGIWTMFQQVFSSLQPVHPKSYEFVIQSFQAGEEHFFLPQAVPILTEDRTLVGVTLILNDVTDLRRLDEMKSNLLAVVSHELKTPLTSIRMATHLLLEERAGPINNKQTELLCAASEDAERLNGIIERLLDIGRMESGHVTMEVKPVSADVLIVDSIGHLVAAYRDKGVSLTNESDPDLPEVMVDVSRIGHVFSNLLDNALKYTGSGGEVTVGAFISEGFVTFTIRDNGQGIPPEALSQVFDRFYRVPGQSAEVKGAGLGLAIAREIVEAHGGSIRAGNNEGKGSCFSFTLKSARAATA